MELGLYQSLTVTFMGKYDLGQQTVIIKTTVK